MSRFGRNTTGRPNRRILEWASHSSLTWSMAFSVFLAIGCSELVLGDEVSGKEEVQVGEGGYSLVPPKHAKVPPRTIYRTDRVQGPMPTNDWWSSLAWLPFSERQYPHPLAVQAVAEGLRIHYPGPHLHANERALFGAMPAGDGEDLRLGLVGPDGDPGPFVAARTDDFSDWFVTAKFETEAGAASGPWMSVQYGHGSPYVYARFAGGSPAVSFPAVPEIWHGDPQSPVLGLTIRGKHYALFGPQDSEWSGMGKQRIVCKTERDYFAVALLPEATEATLEKFRRYAYSHVTDSRVTWKFEAATSSVTTTFEVSTRAMEGDQEGTLLALYPHQWKYTTDSPPDTAP